MTILLILGGIACLAFGAVPYIVGRVATSLLRRVYRRLMRQTP